MRLIISVFENFFSFFKFIKKNSDESPSALFIFKFFEIVESQKIVGNFKIINNSPKSISPKH